MQETRGKGFLERTRKLNSEDKLGWGYCIPAGEPKSGGETQTRAPGEQSAV